MQSLATSLSPKARKNEMQRSRIDVDPYPSGLAAEAPQGLSSACPAWNRVPVSACPRCAVQCLSIDQQALLFCECFRPLPAHTQNQSPPGARWPLHPDVSFPGSYLTYISTYLPMYIHTYLTMHEEVKYSLVLRRPLDS